MFGALTLGFNQWQWTFVAWNQITFRRLYDLMLMLVFFTQHERFSAILRLDFISFLFISRFSQSGTLAYTLTCTVCIEIDKGVTAVVRSFSLSHTFRFKKKKMYSMFGRHGPCLHTNIAPREPKPSDVHPFQRFLAAVVNMQWLIAV